MENIDLSLIWALIVALGVIMYVLLDGFDLGLGILFPFAPDEDARDVMMNSIAPIWDGNETWLILGGVALIAAFPLVYTILLPALYIGVFLMLAGLIFRGVAFEFRFKSATQRARKLWGWSFFGGSLVASFAQGCVVGSYIQGYQTANDVYTGGAFDWLTPFAVLTGVGLAAGYALLGATWLVLKSEGAIQVWARSLVNKLLLGVLAVFVLIGIWTPLMNDVIADRWFSQIRVIWLLPLAALLCALGVYHFNRRRRDLLPFLLTVGLFVFTYLGMVVSRWPLVVPPAYSFRDAASAPGSQFVVLVGVLIILPVVLGYTAWSYWIFRGKVRVGEGYH
ncbi:cytochrome d ubiquinol oxidase subunit II [Kushneria aurantia]|uniref:Cytochrome d ubiquinol oxidase subunit II n=1 Tax=Kushneria aurantia TaxID=504092 RepID=A0ABV6G5I3_9GAMM|nr:cytochrome d ubiquinol oxidase subunit II [Kushneria aurantia]